MHAEPLGGEPIGISLRGDVLTDTRVPQGGWTVNQLEVGLVNSLSERVAGTVRFALPEGWRIEPVEVPFKLGPRSSARLPVTLLFETGLTSPRAVHAQVEHDGQTYEAILEIGDPARLDWDLKPTRTGAVCTVRSDYPQPVTVDAILVTPHELWGDLVEGAALADVAARQERLTVPPKGTASWKVELTQGVDAWATVKLAYHGRVGYKQIHLNT